MPRYFFHLRNSEDVPDEEGMELPDGAAAEAEALRSVRAMASQAVLDGHLDLNHYIRVEDTHGDTIAQVNYGDVVTVTPVGETVPTMRR